MNFQIEFKCMEWNLNSIKLNSTINSSSIFQNGMQIGGEGIEY